MLPEKITLASQSPRRSDLLNEAEIPFEVIISKVEETHDPTLAPDSLTIENARRKGAPVAASHPDALVLSADTLVYFEGDPLGKPADLSEARSILQRLQGNTHQVCTGVCLLCHNVQVSEIFHDISEVTFLPLDNPAIDRYLGKIDPFDKAGAYAAQEHAEMIIRHIEGSRTNVIGLPMEKLLNTLKIIGFS